MAIPGSISSCPHCNSMIQEIQFNFNAKLITCCNKKCTFPFQEENFDDYVIILKEKIMAIKPAKRSNYRATKAPKTLSESRMASIRAGIPDLSIPDNWQFATPLPKLNLFQPSFQSVSLSPETLSNSSGMDDLHTNSRDLSSNASLSPTLPPPISLSYVNWQY